MAIETLNRQNNLKFEDLELCMIVVNKVPIGLSQNALRQKKGYAEDWKQAQVM
jgi:hypothetical protein